ncbi:MAG: MASE1 domain-containing protein, partial [Planctomycetes bacterium]|nr:MASE1 domain-containing protein [Planctomycetota bacterium]
GIALAGMLGIGPRLWPWIFASAFLVNAITSGNIPTSLGIAGGNAAEAVAGWWLVTRFADGRQAFDRPSRVFQVVPLVLAASAVSASIGVAMLSLGGILGASSLSEVWTTWWLGDAMGAIVACPLIVLWANDWRLRWSVRGAGEGALVLIAAAAVGMLVFGGLDSMVPIDHSLVFLCLLPILWAAMRFGPRESAAVPILIMAIAVEGSSHGKGPFIQPSVNATLLLQLFMAITTITGLALAAMVAERRRLEVELDARARDLARSNQELEQFAYVAAHDLQEPLRMIRVYSDLLVRHLPPPIEARIRDYLGMVSSNSERMQSMVRSILDFSRLANSAPIDEIDAEAAFREAVTLLGDQPASAGATIGSSGLPHVVANHAQVVRLFQNLVSNAIKFRSDRPLVVRASAETAGGFHLFSVSDNGIGIPPDVGGKLFGIFHRVHARDQYPGEGIGLASCKKIVEQHGGRIWYESVLGQGTAFRFTLPAAGLDRHARTG